MHASVVVGADGAGSPVRAALGIGSATHAYEHPLVILFAPAPDANPRKHVKAYMGPPGMAFVIPRLGDQVKVGLPVGTEEIRVWKGASAAELRARVAARAPALDTAYLRKLLSTWMRPNTSWGSSPARFAS